MYAGGKRAGRGGRDRRSNVRRRRGCGGGGRGWRLAHSADFVRIVILRSRAVRARRKQVCPRAPFETPYRLSGIAWVTRRAHGSGRFVPFARKAGALRVLSSVQVPQVQLWPMRQRTMASTSMVSAVVALSRCATRGVACRSKFSGNAENSKNTVQERWCACSRRALA